MSFRLNCVSELYKNLGKFDAVVEFTELAVEDFISQTSPDEFDSFIEQKSKQHNIRVNTVDQNIFRSRISQSYILSVYQNAELFIHKFRDECNDLKATDWKLDDTKENLLIKTIRKIGAVNPLISKIGLHKLEIFDYYRIIRNKYSHDRIEDTKVDKAFIKISQYKPQILQNYPNLNAPNEFDNICFDDFILFSRVIKEIAYSLSDIIIPTNEELKKYYIRKDLFKELNENAERKQNALKGNMRDQFGIEENQADEIIKLLVSLA